jgi:hypothetical protein
MLPRYWVWGAGRALEAARREGDELVCFRENLHKWMNFHPFEDTVNGIGIVVGKLLGLMLIHKL